VIFALIAEVGEKKGRQSKSRCEVTEYTSSLTCIVTFFLLYSSSLFFSGGCQLHWIVPCGRIMFWCRDVAGSYNSEQNRPILYDKIQVQMWITTDSTTLSCIRLQVANKYPCFLFWRIFHTADFQNSVCDFLTKQKWRNSLKFQYHFIKQNEAELFMDCLLQRTVCLNVNKY